VFFTYFYTAVVLNPNDLAENMRKYGGFVPGIRPGRKTAEYIDRVLSRITLPGAIFLALIAVLPDLIIASRGCRSSASAARACSSSSASLSIRCSRSSRTCSCGTTRAS
jgi:preprotein translocase subunit SecY